MGEAANRLTATIESGRCYEVPFAETRDLQIAGLQEHLVERAGRIKLVNARARDEGVEQVRDFADVVPLLLPHTAYKSYPESFLIDGKWDKLTRWLGTVSPYPTDNVKLDGITGIDHWLERLEEAGHFVSCTSGTSGKAAMLISTAADMVRVGKDFVTAFAWGSGVQPSRDRQIFGLAAMASSARNQAPGRAMFEAYADPALPPFGFPVPPITIGSITSMIAMRKAIADGTARPGDIAAFETTSAQRQKAMDDAVGIAADALIAARDKKLSVSGMWASIFQVAEQVRAKGYSAKDFNPDNMICVAGGLKGAQLPADYREYIYETFNIPPSRNFQMYGMQEIGTSMPRCQKGGRYHIPPWLVALPLNREGDTLVPVGKGEVEGRAAFFDLSLDGRWGGVISGDRVRIDYEPCACGSPSPSIADDIVRYSDLEGDDKITCSGTVDAYVRGLG